ncbi:MAG TPA: hypothetical protein VJY12_10615 [Dysgonamonadaceae bacterium]|nr:hypothetical protein [Dysgonamonadaceae bacterium]
MKNKLNHTSVSVNFSDFKPTDNVGFVRGVCKVAYAGKNRNYSNIPKEAFELAEPSVFGIPVVGHWIEDSSKEHGGKFGGHDVILEEKGNKVTIKDSTTPFGFVPQDANPRWETVEDENGNSKSYYTVDVVLWQERYPVAIQSIIDNGSRQSMEIMVKDGDWDDNWDYFDINDFYYSALCLLGKDENADGSRGEDDVQPCFEESEVTVGQFSMSDKFTKDLFAIRSAFEGGEKVEDVKNNEVEIEEFKDEIVDEIEEVEEVEAELDGVEDEVEEVEEVEAELSEDIIEDIVEEDIDYESKFNELQVQYDDLVAKVSELEDENKSLAEYKSERESEILDAQKDSIINDYSLILDEDEISLIVSQKSEFNLSELESELSKAFAKKELEKARAKGSKTKEDIVFDNKNRDVKTKKNKFAL